MVDHDWDGDGTCAACGVHFLDALSRCAELAGEAGDVSPGEEFLPAVGDDLARQEWPAADTADPPAAGLADMNLAHDSSVRGDT